jgi:hypothetical protein
MLPSAPLTFSTITICPSEPFIRSATSRPITSLVLPEANGTIIVTGCVGYPTAGFCCCALAAGGHAAALPSPAMKSRRRILDPSPGSGKPSAIEVAWKWDCACVLPFMNQIEVLPSDGAFCR